MRLLALHRSGRIVIEVSDDGAGIDRARVKALAAGKGLSRRGCAAQRRGDRQSHFPAGLLDCLRRSPTFPVAASAWMWCAVRSRRWAGRISIQSRPGQGSTFVLSLPLTLAVLDGMVVTAGGQTLVVPLTAIIETLQPKMARRAWLWRRRAGDRHPRGIHAADRCRRANSATATMTPTPWPGVAILVESESGARFALLVDAILGQRQVVIKSLEANYQHVPGIAAATILGDGRVALILDVDAVVASSRADAQ